MKTALKVTFSLGVLLTAYYVITEIFNVYVITYACDSLYLLAAIFIIWFIFFILLYQARKAAGKRNKIMKAVLIVIMLILFSFSTFLIFLSLFFQTDNIYKMHSDDKKATVIFEEDSIINMETIHVYKNFYIFRRLDFVGSKKNRGYLDGTDYNIVMDKNGFTLSYYSIDGKKIKNHYNYDSYS